MHRSIALALALALSAAAAPASAQDTNTSQLDEAARLTFESAREAFVAGDYERALELFRQAYNLSQRPGLLYNIAQTLDRLRRDEETVEALEEYLRMSPEAPNRSEVEARIRVLNESLANRRQSEPEPDPDPDPDPAATGPSSPPPTTEPAGDPLAIMHPGVFIALAGLALVGGGLTIWAGLETLSLDDQYNASTDLTEAEGLYDDASTMQLLTNVFIGTTAAFGAAAVVFAIITDWGAFGGGDEQASTGIRPLVSVGPTGGSLGLGGQF